MENYCTHCNKPLKSNEYCSICGAYNTGKKATFRTLVADGFNQLFSLERGVFQTIIMLFKQPRLVVRSYYEGYRNRFASPGKLLLFGLIIMGLIYYFRDVSGGINVLVEDESSSIDPLTSLKLVLLLLIPYMSLTSKLIFFTKAKGFMLHVISIGYLFLPRLLILTVLISIVELFDLDAITPVLLLLAMFSTFFANTKIFKEKPSLFNTLVFALIQFILFLALIVLTTLILSLITGYEISFFT